VGNDGPAGGGGTRGALAAWAGWWIVSAALWLALVDNTHVPELVAGAGVAVVAAFAAVGVRRQRELVLRPEARWLLRFWRPPVSYVRELWSLVKLLPTRGGGHFAAIARKPEPDDPRGAARRVFMQMAGTFTPNTYVVGTDHENELLLVHQLERRAPVEQDVDPLRLL
jgi:multisubunit Na+/H+ antiporter MnhE subunit